MSVWLVNSVFFPEYCYVVVFSSTLIVLGLGLLEKAMPKRFRIVPALLVLTCFASIDLGDLSKPDSFWRMVPLLHNSRLPPHQILCGLASYIVTAFTPEPPAWVVLLGIIMLIPSMSVHEMFRWDGSFTTYYSG